MQAALDGEDLVIAKKGIPAVRLVKVSSREFARKPGAWAGLPKADVDWVSPETNAAIAAELSRHDLPRDTI